jgi:hypothetical protein
MHDSSNCPICRGLPRDGSMSDGEFFAFLDVCRAELADKQERFQQRIAGAGRWFYDLADCSLTFGELRFPITPVGTWSPEYQTWLWAWANEDFPTRAREASRQLQSLHAVTGFQVFLDPGIEASSMDAQDFTALAIHQLGAIGLFRAPMGQNEDGTQGPTLFLAVQEAGSEGSARKRK